MRAAFFAFLIASPLAAQDLQPPESFAHIEDDSARSIALFEEMGKVLTHPRCLNCHPVGDSPTQGDSMTRHMPPITRGSHDDGPAGLSCSACHGSENQAFNSYPGSLPGHDPWHLAPVSMGWQGLSLGEICAQLKDPARNGGRGLDAIHEHMAEDGLVGWGWQPGEGRTPAPGSQEVMGALTRAWIDTGAACP